MVRDYDHVIYGVSGPSITYTESSNSMMSLPHCRREYALSCRPDDVSTSKTVKEQRAMSVSIVWFSYACSYNERLKIRS